MPMGFEK